MTDISVIIPTHNKASRLRICLVNLLRTIQVWPSAAEVIVIIDGSCDNTLQLVTDVCSTADIPVTVKTHLTAHGRSAARNAGAAVARGEILLFIDDDILLGPGVLEQHWLAHQTTKPVLARATILNLPWLYAFPDPSAPPTHLPEKLAQRHIVLQGDRLLLDVIKLQARRSHFESEIHRLLRTRPDQGRWLASTGGNLSVKQSFYNALGGFDESFGLRWGVEDLEFGFRAELAGAKLKHLDQVQVYHMDHPIAGRDDDHAAALDYFAVKHGEAVGSRLKAYFAGELDITRVHVK